MNWTGILHWFLADWLENVAAAITLVGIWLTTRRTLICWPVVLISDVLYLIVFHRENLQSDSYLQVFFIGFTLYSWWNWARGTRTDGKVSVAPMCLKSWIAGLIVGALGSIVVGWWMTRIGAALPHLDATLAVFSLVASWWEARKHTANWWLWIVVDAVYVGEYVYKSMWTTAVLYAGFVALAVMGLRAWQRAAQVSDARPGAPVVVS
jgi:nicotinamide mononucleotide transporter